MGHGGVVGGAWWCSWWGMVVYWFEHWALNRDNPGSNPLVVVSELTQFRSFHVAPVHSAV